MDLDSILCTCAHARSMLRDPSNSEPDFVYTDCLGVQAKVWTRPFLRHFLQTVSQDFEVVLFTAAGARHADAVLHHIDPKRSIFSHRLYGEHTVESPMWGWVKDMGRLGRRLEHTLLVDDSMLAALNQPCNLVPIRPFDQARKDKDHDTALPELLRFLQDKVLPAGDVRDVIALHWNKVTRRPRRRPLPEAGLTIPATPVTPTCNCSCHITSTTTAGESSMLLQQQQREAGMYVCAAAAHGCGCGQGPGGTAMLPHAYQDWEALDAAREAEDDAFLSQDDANSTLSTPSRVTTTTCSCCTTTTTTTASGTPCAVDSLASAPRGLHRSPALSQLYGDGVAAVDLEEALNNVAACSKQGSRGRTQQGVLTSQASSQVVTTGVSCTHVTQLASPHDSNSGGGGKVLQAQPSPSEGGVATAMTAHVQAEAAEDVIDKEVSNNKGVWGDIGSDAGSGLSEKGTGGPCPGAGAVPDQVCEMSRVTVGSSEKAGRGKKNDLPVVASLLSTCTTHQEAAIVCQGMW